MPYVEKLKVIKEEKKLTNSEIATLSGIPLPTITRVFNGQTPNPTFETISRIAFSLGVSLDELSGLKPPEEQPVPSQIETTLNSYADLLRLKDDRIKELKEDVARERKDKYKIAGVLIVFVAFVLLVLAIDILNGHFGYFQY